MFCFGELIFFKSKFLKDKFFWSFQCGVGHFPILFKVIKEFLIKTSAIFIESLRSLQNLQQNALHYIYITYNYITLLYLYRIITIQYN